MRILITNDDGVGSPAIAELLVLLSGRHEAFVVAPDRDRSGFSQAITVGRPVSVRPVSDRVWTCDGTPADCVRVAIAGPVADRPDLVVSGINLGGNLGTDLLYSGTAGAARQAAMMGVPALAVSCFSYEREADLRPAARFIADNIDLLRMLVATERPTFLNINVPPLPDGRLLAARPGRLYYSASFHGSSAADGSVGFVSRSALDPLRADDSEDRIAVESGAVSVSAMGLWGVDEDLDARLRTVLGNMKTERIVNEIHIGAV